MRYKNTDDHVPDIDRNNRVVQGRFRIAYYSLPHKKIQRFIILHLTMLATTKLNIFSSKGGISEYYSPHMTLNQINWDYKKHCQYEFGSYVQGIKVKNPTNINLARTLGAIYICPTPNIKGVKN